MNKLAIALSAALSLGAAASANAADGTITFTGSVGKGACTVSVTGPGGAGTTIALPAITLEGFAANPDRYEAPFKISAGGTGCTYDNATIRILSTGSNTTGGYIVNSGTDPSLHTNIRVKLMDEAGDFIDLSDATSAALTTDRDDAADPFEFNFTAMYHAPVTGALREGAFSGALAFDIDNY